MYRPDTPCFKDTRAAGLNACCTPGYNCLGSSSSPTGYTCQKAQAQDLSWTFAGGRAEMMTLPPSFLNPTLASCCRALAHCESCQPYSRSPRSPSLRLRPPPAADFLHDTLGNGEACEVKHEIDQQCGGAGGFCSVYKACRVNGPWVGHCCPDGFTCQPHQVSPPAAAAQRHSCGASRAARLLACYAQLCSTPSSQDAR
jgi:hypothetical protein